MRFLVSNYTQKFWNIYTFPMGRDDETIENGLNMWIVADNVRKGAALNAVQIGEELIKRDLLRVTDKNVFLK